MPTLLTAPQKSALLSQGARAFSAHSAPTDLIGMAANMGFLISSLDELTTKQASQMLDRLAEANDPKPHKARFKRP